MMEGGILAAARGPHPFAGVAVARHRVDTVEAQHGANSFTMFCGLKGPAACLSSSSCWERICCGSRSSTEKTPVARAEFFVSRTAICAVNAVSNRVTQIVIRPLKSPEFGSRERPE
jgi:hypothetical protein